MNKQTTYLFILMLLFGSSCGYFSKKNPNAGERVIARVKDDFLYLSDIQPLVQGVSKEDSAKLVNAYAESWVKKNLMLKKAQEYISEEESGIAKKVEDYRESLILYEYEKELIQQKLDESVTDRDISDYYLLHKNNYILEHDVGLINYIVISPQAADFKTYKDLFNKIDDEEHFRTVDGYCRSFAKSYNITEGVWRSNSLICREFNLTEKQVSSVPISKTFKEFETGDVNCYIRVTEIQRKGSPIPLPLISAQIREMLLNKKKIVLLRDMYDKLLDESKQKQEIEIFAK